jgi:hypothetical protein
MVYEMKPLARDLKRLLGLSEIDWGAVKRKYELCRLQAHGAST